MIRMSLILEKRTPTKGVHLNLNQNFIVHTKVALHKWSGMYDICYAINIDSNTTSTFEDMFAFVLKAP